MSVFVINQRSSISPVVRNMVLILLIISLLSPVAAENKPHGSYCGEYKELVKNGNVTIQDDTHFEIYLEVFFQELDCKDEEYKYDPTTGIGHLTRWQEPDDCINRKLAEFGVKLSSILFYYNDKTDVLTLEVNQKVNATMMQCGATDDLLDFGLETFPVVHETKFTGEFCANASDALRNGRISFDGVHADLSGVSYGMLLHCEGEKYDYNETSGMILFPELRKEEDCLRQVLMPFGLDQLFCKFNHTEDQLYVGYSEARSLPFNRCDEVPATSLVSGSVEERIEIYI